MKVAILAGGTGSRLIEETRSKPKAMIEIGEKPILWHIMKYYSCFGFNEFIIALGYKGERIKRWIHESKRIPSKWIIHPVATGQNTLTGGRIKRLAPWLEDQTFMLTWCDILSDVNLNALLNFHCSHGKLATLTAVQPPSRFGHLTLKDDEVVKFKEKPRITRNWVNGAFFVLEPDVFDYIEGNHTQWEREPLERLARRSQLMAYRHTGFWQCMDILPEKLFLEGLWKSGKAPWKKWKG